MIDLPVCARNKKEIIDIIYFDNNFVENFENIRVFFL